MLKKDSAPSDHEGARGERQDPILWGILLGFLISYLLLFILPTFLNDSQKMMFFRYVPILPKQGIGVDAKNIRLFVVEWLSGRDPYGRLTAGMGIYYPPLSLLLLSPLGLVSPDTAYLILLLSSVACFIALTLWLPIKFYKRLTPIVLLYFVTGLWSYGFQFELQRGQFNVIAMCLAFAAVYLFHFRSENRFLRYSSYLLLTAGIQLKIYPAIIAVGFVRDWTNWRNSLKRLAAIGAANLALLYGMGSTLFAAFMNSLIKHGTEVMGEKMNHSTGSFVDYMSSQVGVGRLNEILPPAGAILRDHPGWIQVAFVGFFALMLGLSIFITAKRQTPGIAPLLLLTCAIGALTIPSRSFDYTLSFLAAPMAIFMQQVSSDSSGDSCGGSTRGRRWLKYLTVTAMAIAYSWTLFSYTNKPDVFFLSNNFPALVVMLLLAPVLTML